MTKSANAGRRIAEVLAPYGRSEPSIEGVTKLSISLPTGLVVAIRESASETGQSVSALIAASIRKALADEEQERLLHAIEAQNDENSAWAEAYLPIAADLWSKIEW